MIRDLVILVGNKLIGLDSILPVAMELKAETPDLRVTFLVLTEQNLAVIDRNYALRSAMDATGAIEVLSRGPAGMARRLRGAFVLARLAARLARRPALLIAASDLGVFPLSMLAWAARRGGGRVMIHCKPAYPGNPALNHAQGSKTVGKDMRFRDAGDAFLVYHPDQVTDYADYGLAAPLLVGSPRHMPAWRRHLDALAEAEIRDDEGRDLRDLPRPVILVFYCGPAIIPFQHDAVRDSFVSLLDTLADAAPDASVVVKPHPICDLDLLRADIAISRRPDVRISHAHPQLLARLAVAAVSLNGSNVMNDMYVEGVPVMETTRYIDDVLAHGASLYPNPGRIDASDPAALRAALKAAVEHPSSLPRPDPAPLAAPKPAALSPLLLSRS